MRVRHPGILSCHFEEEKGVFRSGRGGNLRIAGKRLPRVTQEPLQPASPLPGLKEFPPTRESRPLVPDTRSGHIFI